MKAFLKTDTKPVTMEILARRFNPELGQFFVEGRVIKATYGYKIGQKILEHESDIFRYAIHLKDKFCYAGKINAQALRTGPQFVFD